MVDIVIKENSEIIGFIELMSVGKFFRESLSNYYKECLTEDLKTDLDRVVNFAYNHDGYEKAKIEALAKNSHGPFEVFFAERDLLKSFNNLRNWYHNKVYSPNLEMVETFTAKLKENLSRANIETEINDMLNFFSYSPKNEECQLYTHMFLSNHGKGESINNVGIIWGFKNNQQEFLMSLDKIERKAWEKNRKQAIKSVIQYFPAPLVLHEMTHYYYNKSGWSKKIEQKYTNRFSVMNSEILKLDRLPGNDNHQALSLLNEVLATSFQGILQERLSYQDNREGKLYDSNDLIDKTAKAMIPTVRDYIKDNRQLDDEFIELFLKETKEICRRFSKEKAKENRGCLAC